MVNYELDMSKKLPIIIYGAGVVGETIFNILKYHNIFVECFCDGNIKNTQKKFCGLDVVYISDLKLKYPDAHFIISVIDVKDVVNTLTLIGYNNWSLGGSLLYSLDTTQHGSLIDYTKYIISTCIFCHNLFLTSNKLLIHSVDIIITEKCTLKCKDCSNLMQYYSNPINLNISDVLYNINQLCSIIDEVLEIRIIGGEAFINKDWYIVAKYLIDEPKVKRVLIYTNATILPNKEHIQVLKNIKALVIITNYGKLSKKFESLKLLLESNKISYYILENLEWCDCASIIQHNRLPHENDNIFRLCCAKNLLTLSNNLLFRCPYAANVHRLHAIEDCPNDYIDIFTEFHKFKQYVERNTYMNACNYCNGRLLSGINVPIAIQTKEVLQYNC